MDHCTGESKQDGLKPPTRRAVWDVWNTGTGTPNSRSRDCCRDCCHGMDDSCILYLGWVHDCSSRYTLADSMRYCYLMSPDCYCYACEAVPIKNHLIIRHCFGSFLLICFLFLFFSLLLIPFRARHGKACCGSCDAECSQCCQCMDCSGGCAGVALEAYMEKIY